MPVTAVRQEDGTFRFSGRAYQNTASKNKALEGTGCIVHGYGIVLELLPDAAQASLLNQQIGNARFVRNRYLDDRIKYYQEHKQTLTVSGYKKDHLPALKEEFPFLQVSDKFALEAALEHVDAAYRKFFARTARFPRFTSRQKPSGNAYTTKFTNGNIAVTTGKDGCRKGLPCVKLPKIGLVRFVLPKGRTLDSIVPHGVRILSASVKRSGQRYTASLQLETVIRKPVAPEAVQVSRILGADMGIKSFAALCMGSGTEHAEKVENPRWLRLHEKRLRRLQKALSRKQYDRRTHAGSRNWEKARQKVSKEHRKCSCQRKDFHHKLSRRIADSCQAFICEDLDIASMVSRPKTAEGSRDPKRHTLAREIGSAGWGNFLTMVRYKMEALGKPFVKAGRDFPSTQLCSVCGHKNPDAADLKVRQWECPHCHAVHDRDINAARNLVMEGVRLLEARGFRVSVIKTEASDPAMAVSQQWRKKIPQRKALQYG